MSQELRLGRIGQIAISVTDIKRSVAFYRDALGIAFLFEAGSLAFFDCVGVRLMLAIPEEPEFDTRSLIYFSVEDIYGAVKSLEGRGVSFAEKPQVVHSTDSYDLWVASFEDPDGNHLALMSEVSRLS